MIGVALDVGDFERMQSFVKLSTFAAGHLADIKPPIERIDDGVGVQGHPIALKDDVGVKTGDRHYFVVAHCHCLQVNAFARTPLWSDVS